MKLLNFRIYILFFESEFLLLDRPKKATYFIYILGFKNTHLVTTLNDSSGSPILIKGTTTVFGIHKQANLNKKKIMEILYDLS